MLFSKVKEEKEVVELMIRLYCSKKERNYSLCPDCQELLEYVHSRLDRCRYGDLKPTCKKCPIHCHKKDMRERIKTVMRWSGPRLFLYNPMAVIKHLVKEKYKKTTKAKA